MNNWHAIIRCGESFVKSVAVSCVTHRAKEELHVQWRTESLTEVFYA